jgi:alkylation response protein AidB-like acyl-CoA dehydrogenase
MTCADQVGEWIGEHWSLELTLRQWWDLLVDAGYAFPTWPQGLGGRAATAAEARAIAAALAAAGAIAAPTGNGPNMGAPTLLEHGTADQQRRFVAPLARGATQWCQLFSEPGAGSDLAALATRAEPDGDDYVVSGQKVWNSKADVREWGMLLCRTDPDAPKHRGITFAVLDMRQPGVEVRPIVQMNGASEFSEVFLTDALVRSTDVVGAPGDGWTVARTTLRHERAATAAGHRRGAVVIEAGSLPGNLDRPVGELVHAWQDAGGAPRRQPPLLSSRELVELAGSVGVADRPVLRDKLVRYHVHSEVHRRNGQRLADLTRARVPSALDGSLLKLALAQLAHESRDLSLELLGADALLAGASAGDGGRVLRTALSSFVPSLGGGTNEIQRNLIGERSLGLPREPALDRDTPFRATRRS